MPYMSCEACGREFLPKSFERMGGEGYVNRRCTHCGYQNGPDTPDPARKKLTLAPWPRRKPKRAA